MEEISETKNTLDINIINNNKNEILNNNKFSLLNEIDKIINKSKNQLEEIQLKKQKEKNFYQCDKTINNNIISKKLNKSDIPIPNIETNNTNIKDKDKDINNNSKLSNTQYNPDIDKDFDLERINLKLTSDLTLEKVKVRDLTYKLNLKDKEIESLKQQLNYTQLNYYNKQKQFEKILEKNKKITRVFPKNTKNNDIFVLNNQNAIIVKSFFNYYNEHLELFNQSNNYDNEYKNMLIYEENDINNINLKNAKYMINNIDNLIKNLIKENKELIEQLSKYKDNNNDNNNNKNNFDIDNISYNIDDNIKYENDKDNQIKEQPIKIIEDLNYSNSDKDFEIE